MQTFIGGKKASFTAAAELERQIFIGFNGDKCGANAKSLGVNELDIASGEQGAAQIDGIALVKTAGAITQGAKVASDATGKAVAHSTGEHNGWAVDAAVGANELIRVKLI